MEPHYAEPTTDEFPPAVGDTLCVTLNSTGETSRIAVDSVNHVEPRNEPFEFDGQMWQDHIDGHVEVKGEDELGNWVTVWFDHPVGSDTFKNGEMEVSEIETDSDGNIERTYYEPAGTINSVSIEEAGEK